MIGQFGASEWLITRKLMSQQTVLEIVALLSKSHRK